jgi:hypothetical protein
MNIVVIVGDWPEATMAGLECWKEAYADQLLDAGLEYLMSNSCYVNKMLEYPVE